MRKGVLRTFSNIGKEKEDSENDTQRPKTKCLNEREEENAVARMLISR
jgi:hypothetical protein